MGFRVVEGLIGGFMNNYDLTLTVISIASAIVGTIVVLWARRKKARRAS